jgi:hypothetical protein
MKQLEMKALVHVSKCLTVGVSFSHSAKYVKHGGITAE